MVAQAGSLGAQVEQQVEKAFNERHDLAAEAVTDAIANAEGEAFGDGEGGSEQAAESVTDANGEARGEAREASGDGEGVSEQTAEAATDASGEARVRHVRRAAMERTAEAVTDTSGDAEDEAREASGENKGEQSAVEKALLRPQGELQETSMESTVEEPAAPEASVHPADGKATAAPAVGDSPEGRAPVATRQVIHDDAEVDVLRETQARAPVLEPVQAEEAAVAANGGEAPRVSATTREESVATLSQQLHPQEMSIMAPEAQHGEPSSVQDAERQKAVDDVAMSGSQSASQAALREQLATAERSAIETKAELERRIADMQEEHCGMVQELQQQLMDLHVRRPQTSGLTTSVGELPHGGTRADEQDIELSAEAMAEAQQVPLTAQLQQAELVAALERCLAEGDRVAGSSGLMQRQQELNHAMLMQLESAKVAASKDAAVKARLDKHVSDLSAKLDSARVDVVRMSREKEIAEVEARGALSTVGEMAEQLDRAQRQLAEMTTTHAGAVRELRGQLEEAEAVCSEVLTERRKSTELTEQLQSAQQRALSEVTTNLAMGASYRLQVAEMKGRVEASERISEAQVARNVKAVQLLERQVQVVADGELARTVRQLDAVRAEHRLQLAQMRSEVEAEAKTRALIHVSYRLEASALAKQVEMAERKAAAVVGHYSGLVAELETRLEQAQSSQSMNLLLNEVPDSHERRMKLEAMQEEERLKVEVRAEMHRQHAEELARLAEQTVQVKLETEALNDPYPSSPEGSSEPSADVDTPKAKLVRREMANMRLVRQISQRQEELCTVADEEVGDGRRSDRHAEEAPARDQGAGTVVQLARGRDQCEGDSRSIGVWDGDAGPAVHLNEATEALVLSMQSTVTEITQKAAATERLLKEQQHELNDLMRCAENAISPEQAQ
ncbi:hypothetical protein CYMTET_8074 [Cymbomonas tetramitiformis]|uniref:Uncharacterized protein n=1 Tax=Cymbomonas tetramitiformis TaxID=36881 RepID=A0AAE0GUE5_9CHLO|nr:hypothetical protein CYMTET_8074 [Cymbomonas tetramitiformis]